MHANGWIAPPMRSSVSNCETRNCKCCVSLNTDCIFSSLATGCKFAMTKQGEFNCKTSFVIYLITCKVCGIQYVGQTRQSLHKRLNGHRTSILRNKLNTYLCRHFNSPGHKFEDISIQIIDVVDDYSDVNEAINKLNELEDFYMRMLNSIYPLGLNDKVTHVGCVSKRQDALNIYYSRPIKRRKRSHGIRHTKRRNSIITNSVNEVCSELRELFGCGKFAEFYKVLRSVQNSMLRKLFYRLRALNDNFSCTFSSFYFHKLNANHAEHKDDKRFPVIFEYNCRNVEYLNLASIIGDKRILKLLPVQVRDCGPPKMFFKLNTPISV